MPNRRLSRLLKVKLLRRSSTPAVPSAGSGADPRVHPNSNLNSPSHPSHHFESAGEKSPCSIVSAPSSDDIPADRHGQENRFATKKPDNNQEHEEEQEDEDEEARRLADEPSPLSTFPPQSVLQHRPHAPAGNCTPPPTEPASSTQPTPLTGDLPSPLQTPPLPPPQHCDEPALHPAHFKVRVQLAENQPTTTLNSLAEKLTEDRRSSASSLSRPSFTKRPSLAVRRQSLLPASHQHLISGLLERQSISSQGGQDLDRAAPTPAEMPHRRVWVKRPGGSATLVPYVEDAVVDELRDQVIMKYANSLGRTFDSPDIVIRIMPREGSTRHGHPDRLLNPEETLSSVLDTYYPGGQMIEEALLIDAPTRRTPKLSPRHSYYHHHHPEPGEHGDYFPLMPVNPNQPSPPLHSGGSGTGANPPSISILTTGVPPPLPSPGNRGTRSHRRPPLARHTTNSPTLPSQATGVTDSAVSPHGQPPPAPAAPTVPTPPAPPPEPPQTNTHTPPPAPVVASPRTLRKGKSSPSPSAVFGGLIEGTVPPINVLIVEDNIINQKLLEAFMKRLSVRWKCAANGEEAVRKWRQGGFHLVLMDIQLPVMNGLDATKEIRRLERLNGIGVFSKTASGRSSASSASSTSPPQRRPNLQRSVSEEDTLSDLSLFRSPVIIVALTASSLQSDRHEALAAGCNDFLTKPIGFPWLEQKVTEWGCMQALIDFEGWRKWRGFIDSPRSDSPSIDSGASPMQIGNHNGFPAQLDPTSPSIPRTAATAVPMVTPHRPKPTWPDAGELEREDSWGSGSGGTVDSPTTEQTTPADSVRAPVKAEPGSLNAP